MSKNNKDEVFSWEIDEWTVGLVSAQHYFTDHDGMKKFTLMIVLSNKMETPDRVKDLLSKRYKSVIITPDKGNADSLQLSFTNIDLDEQGEEMTD